MQATKQILTIKVGDDLQHSLSLAEQMMAQLDSGVVPNPVFGVGFRNINQMLRVFTPRRWDLLAVLRENGAMSSTDLARLLQRDYNKVYNDVEQLMAWLAIEGDKHSKIFTPYTEIIVNVHLPQQKAA